MAWKVGSAEVFISKEKNVHKILNTSEEEKQVKEFISSWSLRGSEEQTYSNIFFFVNSSML